MTCMECGGKDAQVYQLSPNIAAIYCPICAIKAHREFAAQVKRMQVLRQRLEVVV